MEVDVDIPAKLDTLAVRAPYQASIIEIEQGQLVLPCIQPALPAMNVKLSQASLGMAWWTLVYSYGHDKHIKACVTFEPLNWIA